MIKLWKMWLALGCCAVVLAGCGGDDNASVTGKGADKQGAAASIGKGIAGVKELDISVAGKMDVRWPRAPGATYYRVTVHGNDGVAQWSWEGIGTNVQIGAGLVNDKELKSRLKTVTVTAWAGAAPLAASGRVPL